MSRNRYKISALLCFIGAFMGPFGGNVVNVLIPRLQKDFAASFYFISLSISLYMISFALFQLVSGFVSDIFGRNKAIILGYGIFGIGCIICYTARDLNIFLIGRFIQGIGNAFMTPILMVILGDIVPKESQGKYMGMFGSVQTSGIFLAPILGGFFAEINWRYVFIILALLAFSLSFLYYVTFRNIGLEPVKRLNYLPVNNILTNNMDLILLSLSSFTGYFGFGSLGFLFAKYIYLRFDVSESFNGILVSLTGLGSIFFSPLAGRLADKYDKTKICIIGIICICPMISILPYSNNIFTLSALLFGMGSLSSFVWSTINLLSLNTPSEIRGTMISIVNSFKYFSFSLSPVFYGALYQYRGIEYAFLAASMITLMQFLIMLYYREHKKYTIYILRKGSLN